MKVVDLQELIVPAQLIDTLYKNGSISFPVLETVVNNYFLLRAVEDTKKTAIVRHIGGSKLKLMTQRTSFQGIRPRDSKQAAFMDSLLSEDILVSVALGKAGTGKTTLALAYALEKAFNENKKIHMTKPTATVGRGKAFGPVPGDMKEKYAPFLSSYFGVLKDLTGEEGASYWELMQEKGRINFTPIELVRGCTFKDTTFILDEAQNTDWHELNTLMSRMGEGTELIILGDIHQVDIRLNKYQTGLYKLIDSQAFNKSNMSSVIELTSQYRSPITALAAEIDEELHEE